MDQTTKKSENVNTDLIVPFYVHIREFCYGPKHQLYHKLYRFPLD